MRKFIFTLMFAIAGSVWTTTEAGERWCMPAAHTDTEPWIMVSGVFAEEAYPCEPEQECPPCLTIALKTNDKTYYLTAGSSEVDEQLDAATLGVQVTIEGIPFTLGSYDYIEVSNILLAEEDADCAQYGADLHCNSWKGVLTYDLSRNGTVTPPHVDSVWVTGPESSESVVLISHAQSQEGIDISFLPAGHYVLNVQIGDCVARRMFTSRNVHELVSSLCDEWRIDVEPFVPDRETLHLTQRLTTDTIINDRQYRQLRGAQYSQSNNSGNDDYLGALREGLNAEIYYVPAGSTHEYLLYAFNAVAGDTLKNVWLGGTPDDYPNGCVVIVKGYQPYSYYPNSVAVDFISPDGYEGQTCWISEVGLPFGPVGWGELPNPLTCTFPEVACAYKLGSCRYKRPNCDCPCEPLRLQYLCDTWNILDNFAATGDEYYESHVERLTTDTIIGNRRYIQLYMGNEYKGALREDENANIYFCPAGWGIDTYPIDYLLYAFNAQVGDKFNNLWIGGTAGTRIYCHGVVKSISAGSPKIYELDVEFAQLHGGEINSVEHWPVWWIEGVGMPQGPAGINCPDCECSCGHNILCAYKNGEQVYASELSQEFGCNYTNLAQDGDTVKLYRYVKDSPGSSTVDPVDPNQIVATLLNDVLTIREYTGEEITYSLKKSPAGTPLRHNEQAQAKLVREDTFRNTVSVTITEDGSYRLDLTNPEWGYGIYGTFDYGKSAIEPVVPEAAAVKILRNGQLLIRQGDRIFTPTGMQIE